MNNVLDLSHEVSTQTLDKEISNGFSWLRSSINPEKSVVQITNAASNELKLMANSIQGSSREREKFSLDQFHVPELVNLMKKVRHMINSGPGFAVINSLPISEMGRETATTIFWLLGSIIGRRVAQKWDETILYEVKDTGQAYSYGVRGSYTNVELGFHNDNAFNVSVPKAVGLLCINPAKSGGTSRFCSFYSVHNELLRKYPDYLSRLYKPIYWDRQKEHSDEEPIAAFAPIFRWKDKQLYVRANVSLNRKGYNILGLEMDALTQDALSVFEECLANPDFWVELPLKPGELQYLNNQEIAHYRSEFEDYEDPLEKRLLIRSWHREQGDTSYNG